MAGFVREVMRMAPAVVAPTTSVLNVARRMRDDDVADVIVAAERQLIGIVSHRDVVVRVVATGSDPATTEVSTVCSSLILTAAPGQGLGEILHLMQAHSVRRVPVVDQGEVVGVLTLGDLAIALSLPSARPEVRAAHVDPSP